MYHFQIWQGILSQRFPSKGLQNPKTICVCLLSKDLRSTSHRMTPAMIEQSVMKDITVSLFHGKKHFTVRGGNEQTQKSSSE